MGSVSVSYDTDLNMQNKRAPRAVAKRRSSGQWMAILCLMASVLFIAALLLAPTMSHAQRAESPVAGNVPGGSAGATSDSELWRALKGGAKLTTQNKDPNAGVAIQTNGQEWRIIKNGSYPTYSAWGILGTIGILCLFFAIRGRIRIGHGGPSGETITRFKLIERLGHWLLASSFIILALTGLNLVYGKDLLLPLIGKEAFASITIFGKWIHNYVAFSFMLALVWVAITWIAYNIPHPRDIMWFLRGGGILGGGHPPAKKFNAGQKVIFWVVILGGFSLSLSGWTLLFPFTTEHFAATFGVVNSIFGSELPTALSPLQEQQLAQLWHGIMSVIMTCIIIAHIYIGSIGMEGAAAAMTTGDVDRTWASEHHSLWVEEENAKSDRSVQAAE